MNLLKEVLKHEVYPALGCTEPIAVAYTASLAAKELEGELEEVTIIIDPGVFKNGMAVTVPNTNGERGNLIAGVLGAIISKPKSKNGNPETRRSRNDRPVQRFYRGRQGEDHIGQG